jgi:hypothetical protein
MTEQPIPEPVVRLLRNLRSMFELELLLLLCELADHAWRPEALGSLLDADAESTRSGLVHLSRCGLVERLYGGESLCFRFRPPSVSTLGEAG